MVGKPIVDIMETHIGFGHIRPLEGSTGVFVCILWRISRFLTTRSLCSLTCPHFVQLSTELFFASYSTGFKLHFESVYRIFPTKIKKTAQEQPSPFMSTYSVLFKFGAWARPISEKLIQGHVSGFLTSYKLKLVLTPPYEFFHRFL